MPELHWRFDGPRENQVDDFRDVDPGIEHVDRDRDGQVVVGTFALEIVDQLLGSGIVVVDHLAEFAGVLRIHFIEELTHQHRMLMVAGENDALSKDLSGRVLDPVFHQVSEDRAVGVLVVDDLVDLLRGEIILRRILPLVFELLDLLGRQAIEGDAVAEKLRRVLIDLEWGQVAFLNRLIEIVIRRGKLPFAPKEAEGAPRNEVDWRRGKPHLMTVEIVKDVSVDVVNASMRFIRDDEVEEARVERLEDLLHCRIGRKEDALTGVRPHA